MNSNVNFMFNRIIFFLGIAIFLLLNPAVIFGQEEFNPRKDFLYDGDYFIPYSPYLTVGSGYGINFNSGKAEQNFAADFHFRKGFEYLHYNVGYMVSTDYFFLEGQKMRMYRSPQRAHNFHAGLGTRYAILKHNFGGYAGLSLVRGSQILSDSTYISRLGPGIYTQLHYHWKPIYDIGLGASVYVAVSEHFQIVGLQFSIMFSGDYKPPAQPVVY